MFLDNLSLINFKSYSQLDINFSSKINFFTGDNGEGKTNILDSIYYLSFCKSFFTSVDSINIKHNDKFFVINGKYHIDNHIENIYCGFEYGKKKIFKRNKKEYTKLAEHIGLIPSVMISPNDINLIIGNKEGRRKFIDGIISQYDREYLYKLQTYNKALQQRNFLFKQYGKTRVLDEELLNLYDMELIENGNFIYDKRQAFIEEIIPIFQKYFTHISQGKEQVSLRYSSQLQEFDFEELLYQNRERDKINRYTTAGIHKDDIDLLLGDYSIKKIGSQGQQKTYLVSLKLAQFEFVQKNSGCKPILLLDDIFDKLDSSRVEQLIKLLADNSFGQVFITDTNPNRINKVLDKIEGEFCHFLVKNSEISIVNEKN